MLPSCGPEARADHRPGPGGPGPLGLVALALAIVAAGLLLEGHPVDASVLPRVALDEAGDEEGGEDHRPAERAGGAGEEIGHCGSGLLATFLVAGFVKGVIGLGLPTVAVGLLATVMSPARPRSPRPGDQPGARHGADGDGRHHRPEPARQAPEAPRAEPWLSPLVGLATGLVTGATGVFVIPAVPYLQAPALATVPTAMAAIIGPSRRARPPKRGPARSCQIFRRRHRGERRADRRGAGTGAGERARHRPRRLRGHPARSCQILVTKEGTISSAAAWAGLITVASSPTATAVRRCRARNRCSRT
jgi:hypothetical protein